MKPILLSLLLIALAQRALAQQSPEIEVVPVQGNIYLLAGAGGNITAQVGGDGIVLVDAGTTGMSDKVLAALRKIVDRPNSIAGKIRYIVNTSGDRDHAGGNEEISKAGFAAGNDSGGPAVIIAHENVVTRMVALTGADRVPGNALPGNTYTGEGGTKDIFWNNDGIQIDNLPNAHTDGDSIVYFRKADVVSAGDILVLTGYPIIDLERGGSISGEVDALNRLLDITIPGRYEEGGTLIVPGHGRICDELELVEYRDMITIIRDRIQSMINKGATLEQVKAAGLTKDYDPEFGHGGPGAWPTDKFVEAVYKSLIQRRTE
jgi:glyoxylase-like metal-dependent hydrolase (beta-lactamase superfamily II)